MTYEVDLAAAAVDAVARAGAMAATASGAAGPATTTATATGGAAGAAGPAGPDVTVTAAELVRGRLGGVPEGPEAVAAVEWAPEDVQARSRLRDKVSAVLEAEPEFAARLAELLVPPAPPLPPEPPEPPAGFGDRPDIRPAGRGGGLAGAATALAGRALGRIRRREPVALLGLAAVVVLLGLAGYGVFSMMTADPKAIALKEFKTVESVLPESDAMPADWKTVSAPQVNTCRGAGDRCKGVLSVAVSSYADLSGKTGQSAAFGIAACASVTDARRVYAEMTADETRGGPLSLPSLGQQSRAFEISKGEGHAYVRVGTLVVYVSEQGSRDDYKPAVLTSLARMMAERAQQAQDGKTPSAKVE
ncbi:hypothetical protein [Streptomyces sp. NPDC089919]|uniref:hypothetical protein n=1 Tax=Streptomyces sp. NPDC089919 TaxID=3155188 RepID=UPI0034339E4E